MSDWKETSRIYLSDARYFPWDWYNGVPVAGPTHTYILDLLIGHIGPNYRIFASGHPSFGEIFRLCDKMKIGLAEPDEIIVHVTKHCATLEDLHPHERKSRKEEVLDFIHNYGPFLKDFQKKVKNSLGVCIYED